MANPANWRDHPKAQREALAAVLAGLDWIIFGGESGPRYREADLQWARDLKRRCDAAGVAFFFKQSANRFTERGTTLDGETVRSYPSPRIALPMCG